MVFVVKKKEVAIMFSPDHFRVNEAWIVLRANEEFLFVKDDPYDIYVLMDAASTYIFEHVSIKVVDEAPQEKDVKALFKAAWAAKKQWAEKLIITENSPVENIFKREAEKNGLLVEIVPLSDLEPIVGDLKESFQSDFMGRKT